MQEIQTFSHVFGGVQMDIQHWVIGLFIILSMIISITTLIGKISELIGKPVRWVRTRQLDHDTLSQTQKQIKQLAQMREEDLKKSDQHDKKIQDKVDKLYKMFVSKEIDDMRWQILNFASSISANRKFSKDQYQHVLDTYEKYKKVIEEHNLTNGRTDASMNVIRQRYEMLLKTGGFTEWGINENEGMSFGSTKTKNEGSE